MRLRLPLVLAGLLLGATGCDLGHDYRVTVTWLINGAAPSRALCRENGVDRVRFTVLSPGKRRSIEADCDQRLQLDDGYYYGAFDSTRSFNYGVRYQYRVEMLDASGDALPDLSYDDSFRVFYGDYTPWVLAPLELFNPMGDLASLTAAWTLDGKQASAEACKRLGATVVAVDFASSTDTNFDDAVEMARADCADGELITDREVLAEGEYNVRYVALDDDNKIVQEIDLDAAYVVDQAGTLDIDGVDFNL